MQVPQNHILLGGVAVVGNLVLSCGCLLPDTCFWATSTVNRCPPGQGAPICHLGLLSNIGKPIARAICRPEMAAAM
jgi:hypothetical protein